MRSLSHRSALGTRAVAALVGVVAVAAIAAACSSSPDSPELSAASRATYSELLDAARLEGTSASQIDVLVAALDEQRLVTFEEYRRAHEDEIACLRDLGFDVVEYREDDHGSWIEISFLFGGLQDQATGDALLDDADACTTRESQYVDLAYQERARVAQASVEFADVASEIVACIEERGDPVPASANELEVLELDYKTTDRLGEAATCAMLAGYR